MVPLVVGVPLNVAFLGLSTLVGRRCSFESCPSSSSPWASLSGPWLVVLILSRVPRGQLITTGPFTLVKHPLYTGVALLVLPWAGFLLDTWLGAALGSILYVATRM